MFSQTNTLGGTRQRRQPSTPSVLHRWRSARMWPALIPCLACLICLTATAVGCGGAAGGVSGSGGMIGSGGRAGGGSGGFGSPSGGSGGLSGGAPGTGGALGTGGVVAGTGGRHVGTGGTSGSGSLAASGGSLGSGGAVGPAGTGGAGVPQSITCTPQSWDAAPIGWATQGVGTTGGGNANPIVVTSLGQFNSAAGGTSAAVIHVSGKLSGIVTVGSNKTILGLCGAEIDGSINMTGSSNVILRNLKLVGPNGSSSTDTVHVQAGDHHLWFDHLDISDGSDGNLDITHGADLITVSWTKFHYSGRRAGAHQFCNLIGHDDANAAEDTGKLNVTFHHVWWADNVDQRMPRVRFGKVHVFSSLYTAIGDSACIEVGVSCNIRSENNVFQGVKNPVDSSHANAASIIESLGCSGSTTSIGGASFAPPYAYSAEPANVVAALVMSGAGTK